MKLFGRGERDRPSPERGDAIGGWCEHCGAAYAVGAEHCPDCYEPVAYSAAPPRWSVPDPTGDAHLDPVGGWCPSCGSSFVPGITECPDCGVALGPEPPGPAERERHDVVEYDLSDWTEPKARELMSQLNLSNITFAWTGKTLHVPGAHEAEVDEFVDVLDDANDADLVDDGRYELAEEPDVVEYEFPEWTVEQRNELTDRLRAMDIEVTWNGAVLSVWGEDESAVDSVVLRVDPDFPVDDERSG